MAEQIEAVRFGRRDARAPDNFDSWSRHSANHLLARSGNVFRIESSFWHLGPVVVTEQRLDAFTGRRDAARLTTAPTSQLTFVVLLEGGMAYRPDGGEWQPAAEPGDAVLLDMHRTYMFAVEAGHSVNFSMDRGAVEERTGALRVEGVLPRTPETGMLVDFAGAMVRRLPGMSAASAAPLAATLVRLAVAALRHQAAAPPNRCSAERAAAIAYIEAQPPGRLDAAAMAATLGLTRATLYRLFRGDGGVLAYDRRRRLRQLHRSLVEEAPHISLGELGARHGFLDLSNLARRFRAQFGLSMSEARRHLAPSRLEADGVDRYREAMRQYE